MNNDRAAEPDEAKWDFLLLYRFGKDGRLMLYLLDEDATRAAIKAGKVKGEIEPGSSGDVRITADPKRPRCLLRHEQAGRRPVREAVRGDAQSQLKSRKIARGDAEFAE